MAGNGHVRQVPTINVAFTGSRAESPHHSCRIATLDCLQLCSAEQPDIAQSGCDCFVESA
jgi:hypothetical protein